MTEQKKKFSREFIFIWLILCYFFLLSACWASGEVGQTREPRLPDPSSSREKSQQNDPFRPSPVFATPAMGSIDTSGRVEAKDCDILESSKEQSRIAIIIDDMGNHQQIGEKLLDLDLNFTFSFLPYAPFTREQEEKAWARGHDILVHMPMEPKDPQWDPGPDALYVEDSLEQLTISVEKNLALVPHAIGVNNHMGSLFTEDRLAMHQFLGIVRQKGLFFVDSGTSEASIGMKEAHEMGIKTAKRHVFLDNIHTQEDICRQLEELIRIARKNGWAIGIGHPNDATLAALVRCGETLLKYVRVVGIHELIN